MVYLTPFSTWRGGVEDAVLKPFSQGRGGSLCPNLALFAVNADVHDRLIRALIVAG